MAISNAIKKSVAETAIPIVITAIITTLGYYLSSYKYHPHWNQLQRIGSSLLGGLIFALFILLPVCLFWQLVVRRKGSTDPFITVTDSSAEVPETHILYGGITAAAMIIADIILQTLQLEWHPVFQWTGIILFFVGILLNGYAFSRSTGVGTVFSNVLVSCLRMVVTTTVIICIWIAVTPAIFPEYKAQALEHSRLYFQHKGTYTPAEINQKIALEDKHFGFERMFAGSIMFLILGCVFSLLAAALTKKDLRPAQRL